MKVPDCTSNDVINFDDDYEKQEDDWNLNKKGKFH